MAGSRPRSLGQDDRGFATLRCALDLGLPPSDAAYARALLAETSPETVSHLEAALAHDPFHHEAYVQIVGMLFILGRHEETRQRAAAGTLLFPETPAFPCWMAFHATPYGEPSAVETWLAKAGQRMDEQFLARYRAILDLFQGFRDVNVWSPDMALTKFTKFGLRAVPVLVTYQQRQQGLSKSPDVSPPPRKPGTTLFVVNRPLKQAAAAIIEAFVPSIRTVFTTDHHRQSLALGPPTPFESRMGASIAFLAKDFELARRLLAAALRASPRTPICFSPAQNLNLRCATDGPAIEAAEAVLVQKPDHKESLEIRAEALKELNRLLTKQQ